MSLKRRMYMAVLACFLVTSIFAAPRDEPRNPTPNWRDHFKRIVQIIKLVPNADVLSPPKP